MSTTQAWLGSVALYKSLKRSGDIHELQNLVRQLEEALENERKSNARWAESSDRISKAHASYCAIFHATHKALKKLDPHHPLVTMSDVFDAVCNAGEEASRQSNDFKAAVEAGKMFIVPEREGGEPLSVPAYEALVAELREQLSKAQQQLAALAIGRPDAEPALSNALLLGRMANGQAQT